MPDLRDEIAGEQTAIGIGQFPKGILLPEHLADLHRSGLRDETIRNAGIRSLNRDEIQKLFGDFFASKATSAYWIPYPQYGKDGTDVLPAEPYGRYVGSPPPPLGPHCKERPPVQKWS